MKRNALVLLATLLLLSASSAVYAVGPDPLDAYGDCEGWTIGGEMAFGAWDHVGYDFTIELYQEGVLVRTIFEEGTLYRSELPDGKTFMFSGRWGEELCEEYTAKVIFWWYGEYGPGVKKVEFSFNCDCVPDVCTYTPGYWHKDRPEWPVTHLVVGCEEYSKAELIRIFGLPTRKNLAIKLFHHLVAAKLNVLIGADDYIMASINEGDAYFCDYGLNFVPEGALKTHAETIKDALEAYNEIPCPEEEEFDDDVMLSIEGSSTVEKAAAATEEGSWGSIKRKHQ